MKITLEWLQERGACDDGLKLFYKHYPGGEADHNDVLRRLSATEDKEISEFGEWLVDRIGFIDETLELPDGYDGPALYYCGNVKTPKDIRTRFRIRVGGSVEAGESVEAGWSMETGGSVVAGGSVWAGVDVIAGRDVRAGGNLEAIGHVWAGRDVRAGGFVRAGEFVRAGQSVESVGTILTGDGHGVYAGLDFPREFWPSQGFIKAKNKPNILSGHWSGDSE